MKRVYLFLVCISFQWLMALPALAAPAPASFADLVEKLSPAVVNISTTQTVKSPMMNGNGGGEIPLFPPGHPFEEFNELFKHFGVPEGSLKTNSLGSGFIISADGYVATNNHVVEGAEDITITIGTDEEYSAEVVGRDTKMDLAVLKIKNPKGKKFPFVPFGNSDKLRVGDWVLAIGNPFGLGGTVTAGIVSARARDINSGPYDDYIQTDAAINRGNSGGPMFNVDGEVVGINTAIFSPSGGSVGIGFAIPSNMASPIFEQLKEGKTIKRAWLGVKIQNLTKDIAESLGLAGEKGAMVAEVTADSPAAKAGIKTGDIITHFGDKEITGMRELPRVVAMHDIGEKVDVSLMRDGKPMTLKVTLGELKEEKPATQVGGKDQEEDVLEGAEVILGMALLPITDEVRQNLSLDKKAKGLVVGRVNGDSEAALRGINVGDIIVEMNKQPVQTTADAKAAIKSAEKEGRKSILLLVTRAGNNIFLALPLEKDEKKKAQ